MDKKYLPNLITLLTTQLERTPTEVELKEAMRNPNVHMQLLFALHEQNVAEIAKLKPKIG